MPRTLQSMPRMAKDVAKHAEDGQGRCQACLAHFLPYTTIYLRIFQPENLLCFGICLRLFQPKILLCKMCKNWICFLFCVLGIS